MSKCFLWVLLVVNFQFTQIIAEPEIPILAELFAPTPKMAMDADGNVFAVWKEMDSEKHTTIKSKILSKDGVWSQVVKVSTSSFKYYKDDPQVVVDAAGNAVAVWIEYTETGLEFPPKDSIVKASIFSKGVWSAPKDLSAKYGRSFFPKIAINPDGFGVIVWHHFNEGNTSAEAVTFHTTGNWSNPVDISELSTKIYSTNVAIDDLGNIVVLMGDRATNMLQTTTLPFAGSWTKPKNLSELSIYGSYPALKMDKSGYVVAVWGHLDGEEYRIQSSTLEFGKDWTEPVDVTPKGILTYSLEVAVNSKYDSFKAIAVWSERVEYESMESFVVYSSYLTEFGWSPQVQLSENNLGEGTAFPYGQRASTPAVTFDYAGKPIVVWGYEDDYGLCWIQSKALDENNNNQFILSDIFSKCYYPQILFRPNDEAVIIWLNETERKVQASTWRPFPKVM